MAAIHRFRATPLVVALLVLAYAYSTLHTESNTGRVNANITAANHSQAPASLPSLESPRTTTPAPHTIEKSRHPHTFGKNQLWRPISGNSLPSDPRFAKYEHVVIAELNRERLKQLAPGDELQFELPQDARSYVAVFSVEERMDAQIRSLSGHLKDYGSNFPITITIGPGGIYASVLTPQGAYSVQSIGDTAWIVPERELEKHVDYSLSDAIPAPKLHHTAL